MPYSDTDTCKLGASTLVGNVNVLPVAGFIAPFIVQTKLFRPPLPTVNTVVLSQAFCTVPGDWAMVSGVELQVFAAVLMATMLASEGVPSALTRKSM